MAHLRASKCSSAIIIGTAVEGTVKALPCVVARVRRGAGLRGRTELVQPDRTSLRCVRGLESPKSSSVAAIVNCRWKP